MRVIRYLPSIAPDSVALAIGNFDGVHRGHQAMLIRLMDAAEDLGLPSAVMTFDPHPREYFSGAAATPRLSTLRAKLEQFRHLGVDRTYVVRFDAQFAALSPPAFVDDVLVRRVGARWVLVGDDFRFGRARAGSLSTMRERARTFSVEAMRTIEVAGERASSSAVRAALAAGDFPHAEALLGRPYAISGRVAHGRKLGRNFGFPTANIPLRRLPPLSGVFAVRVHGLGADPRDGVASLGTRPTIEAGGAPLLEVYVLDFDADIYGRRITVEFLHKIRDEAAYPDLPALVRQIAADVAQARRYFAAADVAS